MFTYEVDGTVFQWHGGAYIDIGYIVTEPCCHNNEGVPGYLPGDFRALTLISVWDCGKDEPTIERSQEAFEHTCDEWIKENA